MYEVVYTNRFVKDVKLCVKRGLDISLLEETIDILQPSDLIITSTVYYKDNKFLKRTPENSDFNQYWFSEKTIQFILSQINTHGKERIGLISTPSIFFSLPKELQDKSYLFDIDDKLISKHKNGRKYDFNWTNYDENFSDLKASFDFIVIDPPFITEEAWSKFAAFGKYCGRCCFTSC